MEDLQSFPHPRKKGLMLIVDLDSRDPLTEMEAAALDAAIERLVENRAELNATIRKISQRILLSYEAKVKENHHGS